MRRLTLSRRHIGDIQEVIEISLHRIDEFINPNGLFDLRLDAGQLFYYEATYSMTIEDKVDPPFTFTMGGTAGVYAPAPPPVPVPEVSLLSVPVMGALAGGLLWRRRKKA